MTANPVEDFIESVLRTEHVLQADDAGEVVVEVDVVVVVGKPQADHLQELVVELHAFMGTKLHR